MKMDELLVARIPAVTNKTRVPNISSLWRRKDSNTDTHVSLTSVNGACIYVDARANVSRVAFRCVMCVIVQKTQIF